MRRNVERAVCILALAFGRMISSDVGSADTPIPLVLEQTTALQVGELAALHTPTETRYSRSGINGAWRDVLVLVRRAKHGVTFRAVRPGWGVIIISPDVPNGECISCATIHYFIEVVSRK